MLTTWVLLDSQFSIQFTVFSSIFFALSLFSNLCLGTWWWWEPPSPFLTLFFYLECCLKICCSDAGVDEGGDNLPSPYTVPLPWALSQSLLQWCWCWRGWWEPPALSPASRGGPPPSPPPPLPATHRRPATDLHRTESLQSPSHIKGAVQWALMEARKYAYYLKVLKCEIFDRFHDFYTTKSFWQCCGSGSGTKLPFGQIRIRPGTKINVSDPDSNPE